MIPTFRLIGSTAGHTAKTFSLLSVGAITYETVLRRPVENAIRQNMTSADSLSIVNSTMNISEMERIDEKNNEIKSSEEFSLLSSFTETEIQQFKDDSFLLLPSKETIEEAVEMISSKSEVISKILPKQYQNHLTKEKICNAIEDCLRDEEMMKMIVGTVKQLPKTIDTPMIIEQWYSKIGNHKCSICFDLLAAPCILSCGHSFCGECINSHIETCKSEDSNPNQVIHCPMCRHELSVAPTFERMLDEDIAEKVRDFPDCSEKRDWLIRREKFRARYELQHRKDANSAIFDVDDDEETLKWIGCAAFFVLTIVIIAGFTKEYSRKS